MDSYAAACVTFTRLALRLRHSDDSHCSAARAPTLVVAPRLLAWGATMLCRVHVRVLAVQEIAHSFAGHTVLLVTHGEVGAPSRMLGRTGNSLAHTGYGMCAGLLAANGRQCLCYMSLVAPSDASKMCRKCMHCTWRSRLLEALKQPPRGSPALCLHRGALVLRCGVCLLHSRVNSLLSLLLPRAHRMSCLFVCAAAVCAPGCADG